MMLKARHAGNLLKRPEDVGKYVRVCTCVLVVGNGTWLQLFGCNVMLHMCGTHRRMDPHGFVL